MKQRQYSFQVKKLTYTSTNVKKWYHVLLHKDCMITMIAQKAVEPKEGTIV